MTRELVTEFDRTANSAKTFLNSFRIQTLSFSWGARMMMMMSHLVAIWKNSAARFKSYPHMWVTEIGERF